ncbi:efflux RND transporter permease subunit [Pseudomonas promysalinigenes]|uniref:efflux RND transporter permease subunit n=1 Tax=Pseudomonas promysalinigenes TaxID=485898 RepID=UPI00271806B6
MKHDNSVADCAVADLQVFDKHSGSLIERALFNWRKLVIFICCLATVVLGGFATRLEVNASFEKTIPQHHPFIENYTAHKAELTGLGNALRVAIVNRQGSIYEAQYLETLRKINDAIFLIPGVDRSFMRSIWTPGTRWMAVTEEGLDGGPVIPNSYDGSVESLNQVRANIQRSGQIGQLVARDGKSTVIYVPLLAALPDGKPLDYSALSTALADIQRQYVNQNVDIHITGFAKMIGDLIEGLKSVVVFFGVAVLISSLILYLYTHCLRSTVLVISVSLIAVIWQLGFLKVMGLAIDPYSILIPFLVFAIGMSHGAQKMNGIMQDVGRGMHKLVAARYTFRRLFATGMAALLIDAVGFAVLMVIDIQVIRELAWGASIGVACLIVTNLILLPILLSFIGVSSVAAERSLRAEQAVEEGASKNALWRFLDMFTERRYAVIALSVAILLAAGGLVESHKLQIGDLDPGAPELRPDSRYNRDVAFMSKNYGASSDLLVMMVKTRPDQCAAYDVLNKVDALEWRLGQLPGVESTNSLARLNRKMLVALNEGNPKWYDLVASQRTLNSVTGSAPRGLYNDTCDLLTLYIYLKDHKAVTLDSVVATLEDFAAANDTDDVQFLLAAGSSGIEAATNIVVKNAWYKMLYMVYGAVAILCFIIFRSWRAVLVAVLPLALTSILAEALMVLLGMGVKVATLPVIAIGVGIGVDYALYILSVTLVQLRQGKSLSEAYYAALIFTGKVVMLTGVTLSVAVVTWIFSPVKFQADMGVLLAFMFVWNMLGALILSPALAYFLLANNRPTRTDACLESVMKASGMNDAEARGRGVGGRKSEVVGYSAHP